MKWAHLPVEGGLYDQHPGLLEEWRYIFVKKSEKERAEQKKREAEQSRHRRSSPRGRGR